MIVKPNQSFLDVILQGCGNMEAGMQVAADNGLPISYMPTVGSNISITAMASVLGDSGILQYLGQNNIIIGTKGVPAPASILITEDGMQNIISEDGSDVGADED